MDDRDYEYTENNLNILRPVNDKYNNYDDEDIEIINKILK
jgi:hypothetical protein